jgi:hypothetical protein
MALWRRPKGRHERGASARPAAEVAELLPPEPRVELTFRDGSSAALDPAAARALADVAQVLTRRD